MKSIQYILDNYKDFECPIDDRFGKRFADFLTLAQMEELGFAYCNPELANNHRPKCWTKKNVIAQLKRDVEFGFEKALDHRGISANLMFCVVQAWCRVLENELEDSDYANYGLPLFKAVALKYGFDDPSGDGNDA